MNALTLEDKIGSLMMVGFDGTSPPKYLLKWLATGRVGGIYLFARNIESPRQLKRLIDDCREAAPAPILVGIDQEGGIVARLRAGFTESPGAMALGAARDPQLAEEVAFMLGRELAALGINWNFAPVADIAHQPDNPSVSTRSVSADHELVCQITTAQIRGFQRAGVAATVKHFPGLGNTIIDTHHALAKVSGDLNFLYENDLQPFRAAIAADVACVMLTHVMYESLDDRFPATLSPRIVDGLLRSELGYTGAVCTDCMEMNAITDGFGAGEAAVLAVAAGVDMPMYSHSRRRQEAAYAAVVSAARSGRIPPSRIDAAFANIQALKARAALSEAPPLALVGCHAHQSLALNAARKGTVLVKSGPHLPPDSTTDRVLALEFSADRVSDAVDQPSSSHFSQHLQSRYPAAVCRKLEARKPSTAILRQDLRRYEAVILLTRNAHLHQAQLQLAREIIEGANTVILICARNPYDAALLPDADTIISTNGDSRPSLIAAVEAICGEFVPSGELTVPLQ